MTHEELLSRITTLRFHDDSIALSNALRAVVELHKPEIMISSSYCVECTIDLETIIYPCPTIRAIQKELG